jgi:superfamily II DNA or RNA helicase
MKLRPYQEQLIKELYYLLKTTMRVLVVSPTGSGKTVITASIIKDAISRGRKCWFIVHREELVLQTKETMAKIGVTCGIIKAGFDESESNVQICSVQTMASRGVLPDAGDVVVIDEAHTVSFYSWIKDFLESRDDCFVIGVTATPWRAKKGEGMALLYGEYLCACSPRELQQNGYLVPSRVYGFSAFDLKGIKSSGGDYVISELEKKCNTEKACKVILRESLKLIGDRTGIIFAVSVDHAYELARFFNEAGIKTETVTAETKNRQEIYDRLRSGETRFVASVGVLTEGFDVPSIGVAILARPTRSKALNVQMFGRALRISDGKNDALILDFAENYKKFGIASDLTREEMAPDYPDPKKGEVPLKDCPECGAVVRSSIMECPECGYLFPKGREKESIDGQLVEVSGKKGDPRFKKVFGESMIDCMSKGYSPDFAKREVMKKLGRYPTKEEMFQAVFGGNLDEKERYWAYLKNQSERKDKPRQWAVTFFGYEYGHKQKALSRKNKGREK